MQTDISIRMAGQVIVPDENGNLYFKDGDARKTNIKFEQLHQMALESQSYEEFRQRCVDIGIPVNDQGIIMENSSRGVIIFMQDEPSNKLVIDRELPHHVIDKIFAITETYPDKLSAIRDILIEEQIIDNLGKEVSISETDRHGKSLEQEAEIDGYGIRDSGIVEEAEIARDNRERENGPIISEQEKGLHINSEGISDEEIRRQQEREYLEKYGQTNRGNKGPELE